MLLPKLKVFVLGFACFLVRSCISHSAYIHVPKRWNGFEIVCNRVGFENLGVQRPTIWTSMMFYVLTVPIKKLAFIDIVGTLHEITQHNVHYQTKFLLIMEFNIWESVFHLEVKHNNWNVVIAHMFI